MAKTIILVSCVSQKKNIICPAQNLYTSDWFRKARDYARWHTDEWYILSAKYGLVSPDKLIEPYDETLKRMPASQRRAWARRVFQALKNYIHPGDTVMFLAGNTYREYLLEPIKAYGCRVEIPMDGLRIGEQKRWLKEQLGG